MPFSESLLHLDSYPDQTPHAAISSEVSFSAILGGATRQMLSRSDPGLRQAGPRWPDRRRRLWPCAPQGMGHGRRDPGPARAKPHMRPAQPLIRPDVDWTSSSGSSRHPGGFFLCLFASRPSAGQRQRIAPAVFQIGALGRSEPRATEARDSPSRIRTSQRGRLRRVTAREGRCSVKRPRPSTAPPSRSRRDAARRSPR